MNLLIFTKIFEIKIIILPLSKKIDKDSVSKRSFIKLQNFENDDFVNKLE